MKKILKIKDINESDFAGPDDQNIKVIESLFSSEISMRGNQLCVNGSEKDINDIQTLVNDIIYTISKKKYITPSEISILAKSKNGSRNETLDSINSENIILHTHKNPIYTKTSGQKKYYNSVLENDIVFAVGPAGTGKTFQAVACAVSALKNNEVDKIVITRPVVEAGEHLGFLPGDLKDKVDPYLTPLYDALNQMLSKDKLNSFMDNKQIEIAPLAYMRGRTLHNSFIILDEAQNSTQMQMKMFLTRIGVTSKAIITGDITQIDLPQNQNSGLIDAMKILKNIKGICFVELDDSDVVRHRLVKEIINAYTKKGN